MNTKKLTLESFKSLIKKIIKEELTKPYKDASNNELAAYIMELNKEVKAHKSKGNDKKAELAMKDLKDVKAELASRKKSK